MAVRAPRQAFVGQEPGALPLCLALARAGHAVTLIDEDPHDRRRLRDMLPRFLGAQAALVTLRARAHDTPIGFSGAGVAQLCTDWTHARDRPTLRSCAGATSGHLIEQIGPDPSGLTEQIAQALGAKHIQLPARAMPLAARFHAALGRALEEALLSGGTPDELDAALIDTGFACGPFALQDRIGLDTLLIERRVVEAQLNLAPLPLFARAVSEGRLGRKASVGWFRYPGQGGAVEDPLVEDMAVEEAHFAGWPRSAATETDMARRIALKMDEFARTLVNDGVATAATLGQIAQIAIGYAPRPAMRPNTTAASNPLPDR